MTAGPAFSDETIRDAKTNNRPGAAYWLMVFGRHCEKHGFKAEAKRAEDRLAFVQARAALRGVA